MGVWDPTDLRNVQNRTAVAIISHQNYNTTNLVNDIAVIRLDSPLQLTMPVVNIGCVSLPNRMQTFTGRK